MNSVKRVLIVDDDPKMLVRLRELLAAHSEVEVVGEATGVAEAKERFKALKPDLIFLDVQMPRGNGFSLLPELSPVPDIIFVTAHDTFAVKAFEVNAADFLLKPVLPKRLALALQRIIQHPNRKVGPFSRDDSIILRSDDEILMVATMDITYIEAARNHCLIHLIAHKPMMMLRRLSEWARLLPADAFLCLDRSHIINLPAIKEVVTLPNYSTEVRFHKSDEVAKFGLFASRRLRKAMRSISH